MSGEDAACRQHPHHWAYRTSSGDLTCSRCDGSPCCTPEQNAAEDEAIRRRDAGQTGAGAPAMPSEGGGQASEVGEAQGVAGALTWPTCDALFVWGSGIRRCDLPALHADNGAAKHGSSVNPRRVTDWRVQR